MMNNFKLILAVKNKKSLAFILSFVVITGILPLTGQAPDTQAKLITPVSGFSQLAMIQGNSLPSLSSPANPGLNISQNFKKLAIIQGNSLSSWANPTNPEPKITMKINAVVTAYNSTIGQCDDTPFVTAAGTPVRDGIIANNLLPFGTKVRIPSLFDDKIFVVEDRMNKRWDNNRFDIWFSDAKTAKLFGIQKVEIEVIE
jgi:3D (Asp-Asp-Asp) domain-containing protein